MFEKFDEVKQGLKEEDQENTQEAPKCSSKLKLFIIIGAIILVLIIIIVIVIVVRRSKKKDEGDILDFEIITVKFPSNIIYQGSHYNYQGDLIVIYKKDNYSSNYFIGIGNDEGKIYKEIYEFKSGEVDETYIHRASSFDDGKRILVGGKILQCTKELKQCDDAKLYELEFPKEIKDYQNLLYLFTEPIINFGGKYIFWSSFDKSMNIMSFVGELIFENDKYIINNTIGLSNFFYDLYDKTTGNFSMPKMFKTGPIKQVINGGEALSIGGFVDYGVRKSIYQSLSEDKMERLTYFEGYDETISVSPDQKLACAMTTRFSNKTSFEIIGLMPTPYSIIAGYLVSDNVMRSCVGPQRNRKDSKGNLGPALVELSKIKEKNYMGKSLIANESWIFYGFISWAPDGKKIMFDEMEKGNTNNRRCQIVKLKNYQPSEIKFADNFKNNVPYNKTIEENLNLHIEYPFNITVQGKTGNLKIFQNETNCELVYDNFSEDNEVFFSGKYNYYKIEIGDETHSVFEVNMKSEGKKTGNCNYRLWFNPKNLPAFEKHTDGNNRTYGTCNYDGKEINADIYMQ